MTTDTYLLNDVRHAAESCQLDLVWDAYEAFCAYGRMPETWKALAAQLSIYLEVDDIAKHSNGSFDEEKVTAATSLYLKELEHFFGWHCLGYLVNDFVTALFHAAGVLAPTHHFKRGARTLAFDILPWNEGYQYSTYQTDVRQRLAQVSMDEICLPLKAIATHLLQSNLNVVRQFSDSWSPCQESHHMSISFLNLCNEQPQLQSPPATRKTPSTRLRRAAARAAGLLAYPDRSQARLSDGSLTPIQENGISLLYQPHSCSFTDNQGLATIDAHDLSPTDPRRQSLRNSKRSSYSDIMSFNTALTHRTRSSKSTSLLMRENRQSLLTNDSINKRSTMQTFLSFPSGTQNEDMAMLNQWASTLKQKDIIPDPELENWSSGRGQHVEYLSDERSLIPLTVEEKLGQTSGALVESVRCMRVLLVRKVVRCNKRTKLKREDAIQEVQQLYRAQHSHVVRLVGTYVVDDELAILTYPCADWNLEQFLAMDPRSHVAMERTPAIIKFFTCLAKALDFLHSFPIKHMDIKPQNILVRTVRHSSINGSDPFKIYFTDFGSSRLYATVEDSETDNWTPFTRTYAAQEVVLQETRGLSADIYSMGCVYAEMLATALDESMHSVRDEGESTCFQQLLQARSGTDGRPKPYYSKLDSVCEWLRALVIPDMELHAVRDWTVKMLDKDPASRPTARQIADDPHLPPPCLSCMTRPGPEAFEATVPLAPWDSLVESVRKDDGT